MSETFRTVSEGKFCELRVDGEVTVNFGEGDGFIETVTDGSVESVQLDGAVVWSSKRGLHFEGTSSLHHTIPLNISLGPIELLTLTLAAVNLDGRTQVGFVAAKWALEAGASPTGFAQQAELCQPEC